MTGVSQAAEARPIAPILVGPRQKIFQLAQKAGLNLDPYRMGDVPDARAAAAKAVDLVRSARAEALMKGSLHTDDLLGITIDLDANQRGSTCISPEGQAPSVRAIPSGEEAVIASHTLAIVRAPTAAPMPVGKLATSPAKIGGREEVP